MNCTNVQSLRSKHILIFLPLLVFVVWDVCVIVIPGYTRGSPCFLCSNRKGIHFCYLKVLSNVRNRQCLVYDKLWSHNTGIGVDHNLLSLGIFCIFSTFLLGPVLRSGYCSVTEASDVESHNYIVIENRQHLTTHQVLQTGISYTLKCIRYAFRSRFWSVIVEIDYKL